MSEHFLTRELAGTGGSIKESPDDFRVEEIPLYLPCGEGEHLYISIEKRGMTTHQLLRRAAETFSVSERDIGYAGLKDSNATTIQTISIPLVAPNDARRLENEQITVLSAVRHRNKLRPGHLAGNRFRVRIAGPQPDSLPRAQEILARLQTTGLPNYFGAQRYGALGNSHRIGLAILRGDHESACHLLIGDPVKIEHPDWRRSAELYHAGNIADALSLLPRHCRYERQLLAGLAKGYAPKKALLNLPVNILRLYLSACQSSLFDRIVDMRLATLDRIWPGDIAIKHINGACFRVDDVVAEQSRADRFEISATAPLFGHQVMIAGGQSGLLEEALLDKEKLALADFKLGRGLAMAGERRAIRVPLNSVTINSDANNFVLEFELPKGSYATSLLREITKNPD